MSGLDLSGIDFSGSNLSGSNLGYTNLTGTNFDNVNVMGTYFAYNDGLSIQDVYELKGRGAIFPAEVGVA